MAELLPLPYPARIRLFAPASRSIDQASMLRGMARLEAAGASIEGQAVIDRAYLRFAGDDAKRAEEINALAQLDALPDVALAIRGGYGSVRFLQQLDYGALGERLRGSGLALMGYSDLTALQAALYSQCGLVTFSGPMLGPDFGAPALSALSWNHCWQTLGAPESQLAWSLHTPQQTALQLEGRLWGGNLAVLVSLLGTPYFPDIKDGILLLEDVGEAPFRLERLFYQLHLAGILKRQRALILGDFTHCRPGPADYGYGLATVFARLRELAGHVPVLDGLPLGHGEDKYTLPLGASAQLTADGGQASLRVNGYPQRDGAKPRNISSHELGA